MIDSVNTYFPLLIHIGITLYCLYISMRYIYVTFIKDIKDTEPNWNTRYLLLGVISLLVSYILPLLTIAEIYPPNFVSGYNIRLLYNSIQYYAYLFLLLYSVRNIRLARLVENLSTIAIYSTLVIFIYSIPVLLMTSGNPPIENVSESTSFIITMQDLHVFESAPSVSIAFLLINTIIFIVDIIILMYCIYTKFDVIDKAYYTFYILVSLKLFGQFYANSTSLATHNDIVCGISWTISTTITIVLLRFISTSIIGNGLTVLKKCE